MIIVSKTDPSKVNPEDVTITFPCPNYPVKVVGDASDDYQSVITDIMLKHAPDLDPKKIQIRDSSKGRFQSITFFITATGKEQLAALFEDLKASGRVKMVL